MQSALRIFAFWPITLKILQGSTVARRNPGPSTTNVRPSSAARCIAHCLSWLRRAVPTMLYHSQTLRNLFQPAVLSTFDLPRDRYEGVRKAQHKRWITFLNWLLRDSLQAEAANHFDSQYISHICAAMAFLTQQLPYTPHVCADLELQSALPFARHAIFSKLCAWDTGGKRQRQSPNGTRRTFEPGRDTEL